MLMPMPMSMSRPSPPTSLAGRAPRPGPYFSNLRDFGPVGHLLPITGGPDPLCPLKQRAKSQRDSPRRRNTEKVGSASQYARANTRAFFGDSHFCVSINPFFLKPTLPLDTHAIPIALNSLATCHTPSREENHANRPQHCHQWRVGG